MTVDGRPRSRCVLRDAGCRDFRCTYRLQLTATSASAPRASSCRTSRELGASHLYLSPSLQARHGSTHGYDVVDPTRISDDLGGEAEFRALCGAAREAGLGVVLDIVPNHMATSDENPLLARPRPALEVLRLRILRRAGTAASSTSASSPAFASRTQRCSSSRTLKMLELVHEGLVDGLRIDHPDGLANPRHYLDRLREARRRARLGREDPRAGRAHFATGRSKDTTGYEFANDVYRVLR